MKPTTEEVQNWLLGTIRHVQHIEYYLERLQLGKKDPQRPHDIMGAGNKFEWDVIKGFAVQYRDRNQELFDNYILPSLNRHRCQYHHVKWNNPNPDSTDEDMKVGALDAVCSLLELDRVYQGGKHTSKEIDAIIEKNREHKRHWLSETHTEVQRVECPNLQLITDLHNFPNIGINQDTYDILRARVYDTKKMVRDYGYQV